MCYIHMLIYTVFILYALEFSLLFKYDIFSLFHVYTREFTKCLVINLVKSPGNPLVTMCLNPDDILSRTHQEDFKKGSSFPQRYGTSGQRPHPATPRQRSKEAIGLRSWRSGERKETPVLPGGARCLSYISQYLYTLSGRVGGSAL